MTELVKIDAAVDPAAVGTWSRGILMYHNKARKSKRSSAGRHCEGANATDGFKKEERLLTWDGC